MSNEKLRQMFRSALSEVIPTVCEDSGRAEWSQGELNRAFDAVYPLFKEVIDQKDEKIRKLLEALEEIITVVGVRLTSPNYTSGHIGTDSEVFAIIANNALQSYQSSNSVGEG